MGNSAVKECSKCGQACSTNETLCTNCLSARTCKVCININSLPSGVVYCEHCETVIRLGRAQISSSVTTTVTNQSVIPTAPITTVTNQSVIPVTPNIDHEVRAISATIPVAPSRTCEVCNADISDSPAYHKVCKSCYKLQLVENTCYNCNRPFKVTKQESYKQLCSRGDCVKLDADSDKRVKSKLSNDGYSKKAIVWLQSIMEKEKIIIQHKLNGGEYKLKTKAGWKTVDGYHQDTNTVYEFYGTYYHGSPDITTHNKIGVDGRTYKDLYDQTLRREKAIRDAGYNVVVMFESEYDKL